MYRRLFDSGHDQSVTLEEVHERGERVVSEMLVIDRVELAAIDHLLDVRDLEHGDAVILEEQPNPAHEAVDVGHVRQHVVAEDHVCAGPLGDQAARQPLSEELRDRGDPALPGYLRDIDSGLDSEHRDPRLAKELEQITIVAGDFDDALRGVQPPLGDEAGGQLPGVFDYGLGVGGEVEIVAKKLIGRHGLEDLDE